MKKILLISLIVIILLFCFYTSVFAEESVCSELDRNKIECTAYNNNSQLYQEADSFDELKAHIESTPYSVLNMEESHESEDRINLYKETEESDSFSEQAATTGENIFEEIYTVFIENSDKIFSSLSFIFTLVIILFYKRGMLPFLKNGISSLAGGVKSIKEHTQGLDEHSEKISKALNEKLAVAEDILSKITESIASLELRLTKNELENRDRSSIFTIISAEGELLLDILMSSSLPQNEKDRIAKKFSQLKSALPEEYRNPECDIYE